MFDKELYWEDAIMERQLEGFKKYDTGKPEFDIISQFDKELGEVNRVMAYGADKYGMDNWKLCTPEGLRRYRNAAIRHLLDSFRNPIDTDSGCPHYAHIITNLLFIAYLERVNQTTERKELNDSTTRLPDCSEGVCKVPEGVCPSVCDPWTRR